MNAWMDKAVLSPVMRTILYKIGADGVCCSQEEGSQRSGLQSHLAQFSKLYDSLPVLHCFSNEPPAPFYSSFCSVGAWSSDGEVSFLLKSRTGTVPLEPEWPP